MLPFYKNSDDSDKEFTAYKIQNFLAEIIDILQESVSKPGNNIPLKKIFYLLEVISLADDAKLVGECCKILFTILRNKPSEYRREIFEFMQDNPKLHHDFCHFPIFIQSDLDNLKPDQKMIYDQLKNVTEKFGVEVVMQKGNLIHDFAWISDFSDKNLPDWKKSSKNQEIDKDGVLKSLVVLEKLKKPFAIDLLSARMLKTKKESEVLKDYELLKNLDQDFSYFYYLTTWLKKELEAVGEEYANDSLTSFIDKTKNTVTNIEKGTKELDLQERKLFAEYTKRILGEVANFDFKDSNKFALIEKADLLLDALNLQMENASLEYKEPINKKPGDIKADEEFFRQVYFEQKSPSLPEKVSMEPIFIPGKLKMITREKLDQQNRQNQARQQQEGFPMSKL